MSKHYVDGIGVKEYLSIMLILIGVKMADTTPALLMEEVKSATWMVPIFSGIFFYPFFSWHQLL
ncbi:hypothetical protein WQ54_26450 [Bacillus sp. SA1-12]|uniref:hypothetical protein n=1 Tax=Bacillus sp. SA1-12 TaxID=1455638 RepID=UPI0006273D3F|nr:hypothetical protein [Bacillus sp. SA1-12]KKI89411.1 hypothetical protein WQ54_26450 [Bacillus sp. SA1-12]